MTGTVFDVTGASQSASATLVVLSNASAPVIGSFTVSPNPDLVGQSAQFLVNVSGGTGPYSYNYSGLPRGCTTANSPTLACTPLTVGAFKVLVTVVDSVGASASAATVLSVTNSTNSTLQAYLVFDSPNSGYAPLTVTMSGNASGGTAPYSFLWKFGNGALAKGSTTVTETYTVAGRYVVTLSVTDATGVTASATGTVAVQNSNNTNNSLAASIVFDSQNIGYLPLTVSMSGLASGGSSPYQFVWSFGDGTNGSGVTVSHTYNSLPARCAQTKCPFSVTLFVQDSAGAQASASAQVVILVNVTQSFAVTIADSPASGPAPLSVSFLASGSGGVSPYSFSWAFGDGNSSAASNTHHTYATPGSYSVVLTGWDAAGSVAQATTQVLVYPASNHSGSLAIGISADPVTGPAPLTSQLSATVTGGAAPYTFNWSFGDGTGALGASVSHTYGVAGNFVADLVVTDSTGQQATTGVLITVTGAGNVPNHLTVFVTALSLRGASPFTVEYTPSVHGGAAPYTLSWNFGDGQSLTTTSVSSVTHTYTQPGTYTPVLEVRDAQGNTASWTTGTSHGGNPVKVAGANTSPSSFPLWLWVVLVGIVAAVIVGVLVASRKRRPPASMRAAPLGPRSTSTSGPAPEVGPRPPAPIPPAPPSNDPFRDNFARALSTF